LTVTTVSTVTSSVWPSGAARATASAPILPPAPGRFSITSACLNAAWKGPSTMRMIWSLLAGGKAEITVTGLLGQPCATAGPPAAALNASAAANRSEVESFSAMHSLLASSDMLAVVQHPFLAMPQVAEALQQIPIEERLPGITVGLHTRADAPLTRPAAALARLLSEIGRRVLQRPAQ
jgi:hypothetical protein